MCNLISPKVFKNKTCEIQFKRCKIKNFTRHLSVAPNKYSAAEKNGQLMNKKYLKMFEKRKTSVVTDFDYTSTKT
jgi:hypothetical protein